MKIDMHIHSIFSDGTLAPEQIIEMAHKKGYNVVSLTDHDSVDGIEAAIQAGKKAGVVVIPGVEINTDYGERDIHILGYLFDYRSADFLSYLKDLRDSREIRMRKMVEKVKKLGLDIDYERVKQIAGTGSVGRPHLARAMLEKKYIYNLSDAFKLYIGQGGPGYVEREKVTFEDAILNIKKAGGIAVLAHPGLVGDDSLVMRVIDSGVDGLEVYHSSHSMEMTKKYLAIAKKHKLLITAGSDCHGPGGKETLLFGTVTLPEIYWTAFSSTKCAQNFLE